MPWVKFTDTYNERLHKRQFKEYKADTVALVKKTTAEDAVAQGKAEYTTKPATATAEEADE